MKLEKFNTSVRIEQALDNQISEIAKKQDRSKSWIINQAIIKYIEDENSKN